MIRVCMFPQIESFHRIESGIRRVVEAYHKYLPEFDVELVDKDASFDLIASHAGGHPDSHISHCHGLYWTEDYYSPNYIHKANYYVTNAIRQALQVTVPSRWVQEVFQRDMRFSPHVIPHGIDCEDWHHGAQHQGFVLWNKNRNRDVCDPQPIGALATALTDVNFITTYGPQFPTSNIKVIGLVPHEQMKLLVQLAAVYLATTKETFGIGTLEALASGTPVLGFAHGGNLDLVQHGVNGYLAAPGNYDDLRRGLEYCLRHRDVLSANAKYTARQWSWHSACKKVAEVYRLAVEDSPPTVSVIIPTYNYADKVERAIKSALNQSYGVSDVIVVDDGSNDDGATEAVVKHLALTDSKIRYVRQDNAGVAHARNRGIRESQSKYICCLDADDAIAPQFIEACVTELEKDRSLGIAYTGLTAITADGKEGMSQWPGEFDYDKQLQGKNQIPTCCVFKRIMWKRLGGYKQRYAPEGAGAEDAEFWLRAGAYGFNAKKVTDAGLFFYSWRTGRVSGNKEYREVDWRAWHPWTSDKRHPFASVATPANGHSHLVRQYDEPVVSVIIPVGRNHEKEVINALDSLEAQTFRQWEAIVVWDSDDCSNLDYIKMAYPYIHLLNIENAPVGAGFARNRGAEAARARLLLFLDADDWLYPEAIELMYDAWGEYNSIVYTDYVGKAHMSREDAQKLKGRLLHYDERKQEAVIKHSSMDYDCKMAVKQPDEDFYIWNLITSLTPKGWHDQIGGFDESMLSWEDWDYWIRMAKAGRCFTRIDKELVVYRFYTGGRRDTGLQHHEKLVEYMIRKHKEIEEMGCSGCSPSRQVFDPARNARTAGATAEANQKGSMVMKYKDEDLVLILYDSPNRGQHKVVGGATKTVYGYRSGGEKFYVHANDVSAQPHLFKPIEKKIKRDEEPEVSVAPSEPVTIAEEKGVEIEPAQENMEDILDLITPSREEAEMFDLNLLPGVTPSISEEFEAMGVKTFEDVEKLGIEGLMEIKGVGKARAMAILNHIKETK